MHPLLAGVIIPTVLVLFLKVIALPYLDHAHANVGVWFSSAQASGLQLDGTAYTLVVITSLSCWTTALQPARTVAGRPPQWVAQELERSSSVCAGGPANARPVAAESHHARTDAGAVHGHVYLGHCLHRKRLPVSRAGLQVVLAVADARRVQPVGRTVRKDERCERKAELLSFRNWRVKYDNPDRGAQETQPA